jgi:hypothetical protein
MITNPGLQASIWGLRLLTQNNMLVLIKVYCIFSRAEINEGWYLSTTIIAIALAANSKTYQQPFSNIHRWLHSNSISVTCLNLFCSYSPSISIYITSKLENYTISLYFFSVDILFNSQVTYKTWWICCSAVSWEAPTKSRDVTEG